MLHMFIDMTAPTIERIRTAQNEKDFHELMETAHSLKGGARSACCCVLGDLAAKLQEAAEKEIPAEKLVKEIEQEFARVTQEIKNLKTA